MGDIFRGWRRKTGMITLALACASMVGWVQTKLLYELLELKSDEPPPFSYITVSLTLMSAFLLLIKPRKSTRQKATGPAIVEKL